MDKYIFLDIDGVIATQHTVEGGMWGLTPEKQSLLGDILAKTDAKIVLTSSWRYNTVEETQKYMTEKGFMFSDKIVGVTIRAYQYIVKGVHLSIPRGVEIKQWIDTHVHSDNGKNWERKKISVDYNYVIIDDDTDMLLEHKNRFVNTDSLNGLNENGAYLAIAILNNNL